MKKSNRLSTVLHALVHMADEPDDAVTSETLAGWLQTNPVVVRRSFGLLREAGLVRAERGPGGGWVLARPAKAIAVSEIYAALNERVLVAIAAQPLGHAGCAIERTVTGALKGAIDEAESLVTARLARLSLGDLLAAGHGGFAAHRKKARHHAA